MLVQKLKSAESRGEITGLKVARSAPAISHLLYANDSMFYCKQSDEEITRLSAILQEYSMASGQRINYQKSSLYFGKNIPSDRREEIKLKLGMAQEGGEGIYLGLPESFGGSKVPILSYLKERMEQRIGGWQNKFLSPGGKEVLLKAVALALPTYTMSCFLIPKTICKKIASLMSDFWWKTNKESKGMHWRNWDYLCRPKDKGGFGFKDLEAFNIALLGKQLWRMITHPTSLLARVFKSRYFRDTDPLNATLGSRPSVAWRSIHVAQNLIKQGAKVIIGNGRNTNIWDERWLGSKHALLITATNWLAASLQHSLSLDMRVSDLMTNPGTEWNEEMILRLFPQDIATKIISTNPHGATAADAYSWEFTKTGHYTVKSGYWVQLNIIETNEQKQKMDQPSLDALSQRIWKQNTGSKIHHFLWKCVNNALPAAANMKHRHITKDGRCMRCSMENETINHILFECPYARLVWALSPVHAPVDGTMSDSLYSNLWRVMSLQDRYPKEEACADLVPWLLWRIWKNRNDFLFQGKDYAAQDAVNKALEDMKEWLERSEEEKKEVKKPTVDRPRVKWKPPPEGWIKCNADGSWHKNRQNQGVGWVSRDYTGRMLWAGARRFQGVGSPIETEATALQWAIQSMIRFGYKHVQFETDSLVLAKMINGKEETWPKLKPIIQEITHSLSTNRSYRVEYFAHEGNKTADRIVKEAFSFMNHVPKLYFVMPSWLIHVIEADMPSLGSNYDVGPNNVG